MSSDLVLPSPPSIPPGILRVLEDDAHASVRTTQDYIWSSFWSFGVFLLIVIISFFAIWALTVVVGFLQRQCGMARNFQRVAKFMIWIFLGVLALVLAFIAIGLDFAHILISLSVSGLIFSYGLGQTIGDLSAGIFIQSSGNYEIDQEIEVMSGGSKVRGMITEFGPLHVRMQLRSEPSREQPQKMSNGTIVYPSHPGYAYVPNSDCRFAIFYRRGRPPKSVPTNQEIPPATRQLRQATAGIRQRSVATMV